METLPRNYFPNFRHFDVSLLIDNDSDKPDSSTNGMILELSFIKYLALNLKYVQGK